MSAEQPTRLEPLPYSSFGILRQNMYLALLQQAFGMAQPAVRHGICIFHKPL